MNKAEVDQLVRLLRKLKTDGLVMPNMPVDVWHAIGQLVPTPAVEVLITNSGKDFLLVHRKDRFWNGWHIPGGFMLPKESIEKACNRIAKTELGVSVKLVRLVTAHMWKDHPYANSLSLVCECSTLVKPKAGKFFAKIPSKIVLHHKDFIIEFLNR